MRVKFDHDVESNGVGVAGGCDPRSYGRCTRQWQWVVERDGGGRYAGLVQLLGMEHRGWGPHGPHHQREHPHHPRRHDEPSPVIACIQPIRVKLSHIRPDGGLNPALPSSLLPRRWLRQNQVVLPHEVHSHNTRVSRLHLQHHRHRCRQVRISCCHSTKCYIQKNQISKINESCTRFNILDSCKQSVFFININVKILFSYIGT